MRHLPSRSSSRATFAVIAILALFATLPAHAQSDSLACAKTKAPLFSSQENALEMNFYANHASIHDQTPDTFRDTPAIIEYTEEGYKKLVAAQVEVRGKSRFQCLPKPIRINFEDEAVTKIVSAEDGPQKALEKLTHLRNAEPFTKGTPQKTNLFADVGGKIKMVNECKPFPGRELPGSNNPEIRQSMLLREYYVYKTLEVLNTTTLTARLAKVKYTSPDETTYWSGYSFFLEPLKGARKRCGLSKTEFDKSRVNPHSTFQNEFLQRFIGNMDFVPEKAHNIELGQDKNGDIFFIPYDFDLADLVLGNNDTDFHNADFMLEEFISAEIPSDETASKRRFLTNFLAQKPAVLGLYERSLLDDKSKKVLLSALERRFSILARQISPP